MKLDQFETWLFDLDGTLVYSLGLVWDCMSNAAKAVGGEISDQEAWKLTIGTGVENTLSPWVPADRLEEAIQLYLEDFHQRTEEEVPLHDGVLEILETLKQRQVVMGVVTGKREYSARDTLEKKGILQYFTVVVGADTIAFRKPSPEPVLHALQELGRGTNGAVFVGDSEHDITSGRLAGVKTIAVEGGSTPLDRLQEARPDWTVRSIRDILQHL